MDNRVVHGEAAIVSKTSRASQFEIEVPQRYDAAGNKLIKRNFNELETVEQSAILFRASLLTFNAGYINAVTQQARRLVTSHITGHVSQLGIYMSENDTSGMEVRFSIILAFVIGGFIPGCILDTTFPYDENSTYAPVFFIQMVITLLASLIGHWYPDSDWFVYMAAAACGIQNGASTVYSQNLLRTSHMSGAFTDMGLIAGRWLRGYNTDMWKLPVLFVLFISFVFGGVVAGLEYQEWTLDSFIFSAVFIALLMILDLIHVKYRYGTFAKAYGFA